MSTEGLADRTTFVLLEAAGRVQRSLGVATSDLGIGLRELRLLALIEREGPLPQRELTRITGIDKSPMVGLVDALETKQLAQRRRDPADRRVTRIALTSGGRSLLKRAARRLKDPELLLLEALDQAERRSLQELLLRIKSRTPG
jgi:DNA-binding MarR family transcriptional regulator